MIAAGLFLLSAGYYILEYFLLAGRHFYPADLVFAGIFVWRIFFVLPKLKESAPRTEIVFTILIITFPLTYLIKFLLDNAHFNVPAPFIYAVLMLGGFWFLVSNPLFFRKDKKILKEHTIGIKDVQMEPFSIKLNNKVFIPGSQRFLHEQVIGASGTGKTYYVFKPHIYQDIQSGAGLFIYDIKSNMRADVEAYTSIAVRDYDLYTFNLGDLGSDTYNPLANGTATEIKNRVFSALYEESSGAVDFYKDYAEQFLSNTIALLKYKYPIITFKDLYLLAAHPTTKLKRLCVELDHTDEAKFLLKLLVSKDMDDRLIGLRNKLSAFATPPWTDQINQTEPDITMTDILTKNKILLFQANSGLYQYEYKPISILAMKDLQTEVARRYEKRPEKPFAIYLDEFYNIIYKGFVELINKAREARVMIVFGHQSLGDLERCGEDVKNAILTNSAHKIVLNLGETNTARYFAELFGTRTIKEEVESHKSTGEVAGRTDAKMEEFVFNPNVLKSLKTDSKTKTAEAVVLIRTNNGKFNEQINLKPLNSSIQGGKLQKRPKSPRNSKTTNLEDADDNTGGQAAEKPPVPPRPEEPPAAERPKRAFKRKGIISAKDIAEKYEKENGSGGPDETE